MHNLDWLLGQRSDQELMTMAKQAQALTRQHFGHSIELYTPVYTSNHCANRCTYCGFSADVRIARTALNDAQLEAEALAIKSRGIEHVLMVTGEHPKKANIHHFLYWLRLLKQHFHSVSIECQQLTMPDYQQLNSAGIDGVYLYQETYNESIYKAAHLSGFKADFQRRLKAPFDMASAGIKRIGLGVLLGLNPDWRSDAKALLSTSIELKNSALTSEISISLPRLREAFACEKESTKILMQIICAARIMQPRLGITLSTREPAWVRDLLLPYGVTSASVDSSTAPAGHSAPAAQLEQFAISDSRTTAQFSQALKAMKLAAIHKNWQREIGRN